MKLFLSSYRAGEHADRLVQLFGGGAKVVVIHNAKDYRNNETRQESTADFANFISELGFEVRELDLREYFGVDTDWYEYLQDFDAIWLAGGNTFVLRRALSETGIDKVITELVRSGKLVFGGESAGAIMATPDFTGVEFGDDPDILPVGYTGETPRAGLGLVGYSIVPHYESDWPGSKDMALALQRADRHYKTLTNSAVLVVDGSHQELLA